jgi:hypothetical protein
MYGNMTYMSKELARNALTKAHIYSTLSIHIMPHRAHILLPEDLLREIDALVGPRGRSAFLVETARKAVRRQKLLQFLESGKPAWQDQDHLERMAGSAEWVRKLRSESEPTRVRKRASKRRAGKAT